MEERRDDQVWVVVTSDGQNYIGPIAPDWMEHRHKDVDPYETKTLKQKVLLGLTKGDSWITLLPAYEFHCPMVSNEQGQIGRRAMVTHPDFVIAHQKVPIHLHINKIYFFDDLDDHDRTKYKAMITQADGMIEATLKQSRAQSAGLQIVPAGAMPRPRA